MSRAAKFYTFDNYPLEYMDSALPINWSKHIRKLSNGWAWAIHGVVRFGKIRRRKI